MGIMQMTELGASEAYSWYFPTTGGGDEDGINDPLRETFEGQHEHYIARESIQNSLDARLDDSTPVRVSFDLMDVDKADIPKLDQLQVIMTRAYDYAEGQERAAAFYETAIGLLSRDTLAVLKVSDFNTSGLDGQDDDKQGGWYRLIRASGSNSMHGVGGGSFGIGKGAPFAASQLRTVLYGTVNGDGESVFQGKARLSSYIAGDQDVKRGVGQLGFLASPGVKSVRNPDAIPSPFRRTQRGTDLFVLGYRSASDVWHQALLKSVLANFWAAVHFGDLVVDFRKNGQEILQLNAATLGEIISSSPEFAGVRPYFDAVNDRTRHFKGDLPLLGQVHLYVKTGANLPRKIQMMRRAKMTVFEKNAYALSEPFAGVFICDDPEGNRLLRGLEPPAHDKWDQSRDREKGARILRYITDWIKRELKTLSPVANSDPEDIPDLAGYLPERAQRDDQVGRTTSSERTQETSPVESGAESAKAGEAEVSGPNKPTRRTVEVTKPRQKGGGSGGRAGEPKNKKKSSTQPPKGGEANTSPALDTSKLLFRSREVVSGGRRRYSATLHPETTQSGALEIVAIGEVVSSTIPVESVQMESGQLLEIEGSRILNLELEQDVPMKLMITLKSTGRYTLGVA
ncbi:hypothetical protein ACVWYS_002840 [Arthrobacter sp. TE12231]